MADYHLSTAWHQGNPFNIFCPVLSDGSRTLTGCTATAAAQIIYYWLEQGYSFDLSFEEDDSCYVYDIQSDNFVLLNADNIKSYCGVTFQELNTILASYRQDGQYDKNTFLAALNLLTGFLSFACYDLPAIYGTSGGANRETFTRLGFQSVNELLHSVHFFDSDSWLFRELSESGFKMLGEWAAAGNVICVEMWNPAHVAVIDGYDPVSKKLHLNMGWGGEGNRWYTREELNAMQIDRFLFDIYPVCDDQTLVISNTALHGEGSFYRTLQKSSGIEYITDVVFAPSLAGQKIVINEVAGVARTRFPDFNGDVQIIADSNLQYDALRVADDVIFEKFSGSLAYTCENELFRNTIGHVEDTPFVIKKLSGTVIWNAPNTGSAISGTNLTLTMDGGGIFAGSYLVSGSTYADSVDMIQELLEAYSKNGQKIDLRLRESATGVAISCPANVVQSAADDTFIMQNRSVTAGDVYLGNGNDRLELYNGSIIAGDVKLGPGDDHLLLDDGAVITGDVWYQNASTEIVLSDNSIIYGRLIPTQPDSDVRHPLKIDSSSVIYGMIPSFDNITVTINSAPVSDVLLTLISSYRLSGKYTIILTPDLTAGTYNIMTDYSLSRMTVCWRDEDSEEEHLISAADWDKEFSYNGYTLCFSMGEDRQHLSLTVSGGNPLTGDKNGLSFTGLAGDTHIVEISRDNFSTVLAFEVERNAVDIHNLPAGTYQWQVDDIRGNDINGSGGTAAPQMFTADGDSDPELFFARPDGVWGSGYAAEYQGDFLPGISEPLVLLQGRNKITDCFNGSGDENILLLTDDDNGDAVFADDLYSARPSEADEMQSRLSYIREIRAGAGNDVIDLTSSSLCCDGWEMTIHGGDGDDVIWASGGDNDLFGDAGNDRIIGSSGFDVIAGGTGNDCMQSGGGDDIFCFGSNWGNDTVVLNSPAAVCTLWFASGSANNWDAAARIYRSGSNSVTVLGEGNVQLYFGNDSHAQPNQYADLQASGAFSENSSEKIFEDKSKGLLA